MRHLSAEAPSSISAASDPPLPSALINDMENQEILIDFNDGDAVRYPSFWLRDNCPCSICRHPSTHQRQINTFAIDPAVKADDVEITNEGLKVSWCGTEGSNSQVPEQEAHISLFPWDWLQTHTPFPSRISLQHRSKRVWQPVPPTTSVSSLPTVAYESVMSHESGLKELLTNIHVYGFSFISSTPVTPEDTEKLLNRIAFIRPTHYGAFWDFTSEPDPIDTAYTNLELPLHTDTTYFTDPAGLQLFHCLSHTPSSSSPSQNPSHAPPSLLGGESTFSDGFQAATHLFSQDKQAYTSLSTYPIISSALGSSEGPFHNANLTSSGHPVLIHSSPHPSPTPSTLKPSTLTQIRWNNTDRSPLTQFPTHQSMKSWYKAARSWERILQKGQWEVKLRPGMPVIFDNWRILHGRKAFEGKRRVCGGYVGMDDFRAKARKLGVF